MVNEEEIQKAIQKEKEKLQLLITAAEKSIYSFDLRIRTQSDQRTAATKDLEIALEATKKPYNDAIASMEKDRDEISNKKHGMQMGMNAAEFIIRAKFAENLPEFPDAESFKGFMILKHIFLPTVEMIKKKLQNGVMLFTAYQNFNVVSSGKTGSSKSNEVAYFAVKGKDIIGFIFTKKSKHPGDSATVYCWINSRLLRNSTQLSKNDYMSAPTVGFKKWKQMVSELKEFTPIDLSDEKNQKVFEFITKFVEYDAMED